jgi:peptidyl-prolyl cis-trans isomerase C
MRMRILIAGFALAGASGCSQTDKPASPPVASVAGQSISEALFDAYAKQKSGVPAPALKPEMKKSLLLQLRQLKAASLAGEKLVDPEIAQAIELQRLELLAARAAAAAGVDNAATDAELHQAYDSFVRSLPASEFRTSHILVATESAAEIIIVKLQAGEDFGKLARAESADNTKSQGGDLGWISPGKLPAAFTDAVKSLKPGAFTSKPVHTLYGWHVIKLIETRQAAAPSFDQVKAQLAANLRAERYTRFLEGSLRASGQ